MSRREQCARCGHWSGWCERCGRKDPFLGAGINNQPYCHTFVDDQPSCYTLTSRELTLAGTYPMYSLSTRRTLLDPTTRPPDVRRFYLNETASEPREPG